MSGADVKRQVREALMYADSDRADGILRDLDGCVLLTAEEADRMRRVLDGRVEATSDPETRNALALLTPEQEQTDEEFISEQTGGPC